MEVFYKDIGVFDEAREDLAAVGSGGVECERLLVGVELQEVITRAVGVELEFLTSGVAGAGTFDFDYFGSEPCEKLCAGRAGLDACEIHYLDALKRCCVHSIMYNV